MRHFAEHVVGDRVPTWEAYLGQFQADFDHGLKTKFVVHVLLYIFRLRLMVIRIID